jgi:hypothetical protein
MFKKEVDDDVIGVDFANAHAVCIASVYFALRVRFRFDATASTSAFPAHPVGSHEAKCRKTYSGISAFGQYRRRSCVRSSCRPTWVVRERARVREGQVGVARYCVRPVDWRTFVGDRLPRGTRSYGVCSSSRRG